MYYITVSSSSNFLGRAFYKKKLNAYRNKATFKTKALFNIIMYTTKKTLLMTATKLYTKSPSWSRISSKP